MTTLSAVEVDGRAVRPTPAWHAVLIVAVIAMNAIALVAAARRIGAMHATDLAQLADGRSYCAVANHLATGSPMRRFDQRVFLGLPLALAAGVRAGLPPEVGGLLLSTAAAAAMLCALAAWLGDVRPSLLLAFFPPQWLLDRSLVYNESLMLALCVAGAYVIARWPMRAWAVGALLLAFATLVRPNAAFAAAGIFVGLAGTGRRREAAIFALSTGAAILLVHGVVAHVFWSVLESARVYRTDPDAYGTGTVLTYPFGSYLGAIRHGDYRQLQFWYKAAHAIVGVALAGWLCRKAIARPDAVRLSMATWGVLGVLFAVSIGSFWGVRIQHRSLTWACPPLAFAAVDLLPTRGWRWLIAGLAAVAIPFLFLAPFTVG